METKTIDITTLSEEQRAKLLEDLKQKEHADSLKRREAYEDIKKDLINRIAPRVKQMAVDVADLYQFVVGETAAFYDVMKEYGQLRREGQMSYQIIDKNFKIEVKSNKVKKFDERADIASQRLIEFLEQWIKDSDKGTSDPMYQLAMTLLERNQNGDLDYKSISKLYQLEKDFDSTEYSEIMQLFKESNIVEGTATNFYFHTKDKMGVWRRVEINFNRL